MEASSTKRLNIAYIVVAIVFALMMFFSASFKLTMNPQAVHVIHEVVGVPLNLLPLLAGLEVAGGLGLLAGIFRPRIGVSAGVGLVLYFIGAIVAHVRVADWDGVTAPVTPLLLAIAVLTLRILSMRPTLGRSSDALRA